MILLLAILILWECNKFERLYNLNSLQEYENLQYTTLIKQPRFGNLSKFLPIVPVKISSPDSDLALKH